MEKFGDPEFLTHATAARLYTLIAMRAAGRRCRAVQVRSLRAGACVNMSTSYARFTLDACEKPIPRRPTSSPSSPAFPPWSKPSARFGFRPRSSTEPPRPSPNAIRWIATNLARLNDQLSQVERAFLLEKGLPERPWFKHAIYAPGLTTGYAAWPLPAIRQALEDKNKAQLAADVPLTVERIKKATAAMESACKHAQATLGMH